MVLTELFRIFEQGSICLRDMIIIIIVDNQIPPMIIVVSSFNNLKFVSPFIWLVNNNLTTKYRSLPTSISASFVTVPRSLIFFSLFVRQPNIKDIFKAICISCLFSHMPPHHNNLKSVHWYSFVILSEFKLFHLPTGS